MNKLFKCRERMLTVQTLRAGAFIITIIMRKREIEREGETLTETERERGGRNRKKRGQKPQLLLPIHL